MSSSDPGDTPSSRRRPEGGPLLEICNAMVGLYKEALGRGPTRVRARCADSETLVVLLHGTLTVAERTLAAQREHQRVEEQRRALQRGLESRKRAAVERILDRRTHAVIAGIDVERDLAAEIFVFEPAVAFDAAMDVSGAADLDAATGTAGSRTATATRA